MNSSRVHKTQRTKDFLASPEGLQVRIDLMAMVDSLAYKTESSYSPNSENGNLLFIDKHMDYLCSHTSVNPAQYVSNLKLITKIRK